MSTPPAPQLTAEIKRMVKIALDEDIGSGDITAELIHGQAECEATIVTREPCVVCGVPWVEEVFRQLTGVAIVWQVSEGDFIERNTILCTLHGNARSILSGERTALNFLQLLSGTATTARQFAALAQGTSIKVLDTRKTIPGLRHAQKYAVQVGGCENHRMGLYDAFLIKENHIAACGGISAAIERALALHPDKPIIVEVETYAEYCQAIAYPIARIMLDSLSAEDTEKVFAHPSEIPLEISGNIDSGNLSALASTPVAALSSGALTKNLRAIDLSMRVQLVDQDSV